MNYIVRKFLKRAFQMRNRRVMVDLFYLFSLYYIFFGALIVSDLIAIGGLVGLLTLGVVGPYTFIWFLAAMLFFLEMLIAVAIEEEESFVNIVLSLIMYFTYSQLWLFVVIRAIFLGILRRGRGAVWDKTIRYR